MTRFEECLNPQRRFADLFKPQKSEGEWRLRCSEGKEIAVKIANIETYIYKPTWNWLFLKMETDEGIYGWGEATTQAQEKDVEACIHNLADYLIGKDPRDIELHWSTMFRNSYWRPSFVVSSAMRGLDMAMWDILGKTLGAPVCDRIKVYHNGWWFPAKSTDDYVWLAEREVKEHGAKALKWDPFWGCDVFTTSEEDIRKVIDNVARVRRAGGDDVELMIDCHSRLTTNGAIRFAHAVAEYKPAWFEEPIPTDAAPEDLARVAASTDIPIVTGERVVTRWCFRDIFEKRAVATINPDPCHAGGVSMPGRRHHLLTSPGIQPSLHLLLQLHKTLSRRRN